MPKLMRNYQDIQFYNGETMKKGLNWRSILFFIIEIVIPIIITPLLPSIITDFNEAESLIISICVSILIAIWNLDYKFNNETISSGFHRKDTKKEFDSIHQKFDVFETFYEFQETLNKISHPYFKKQIDLALEKDIEVFVHKNNDLFNGYVETNPYENRTFGVEGLKWTNKSIFAVSSVNDYWERDSFIDDYLLEQYNLIENRNVTIKRIFIATANNLKKISRIMETQKEHGIEVYYIDSSSVYFNKSWEKEDFLIQDETLLVDLQCDCHKYNHIGKEIITVSDTLIHQKMDTFKKMLENAKLY